MEIVRQKNQATYIVFPIIDNDGDAVSSAAGLDSEIDEWNDGGAPDGFVDCTNEATEIGSTGIYYLLLTAAEMNYDYIYIQIKTTTEDAKTQHLLIRTMIGDPLLLATTTGGSLIWSVATRALTTPNDYKATGFATSAALITHDGKLDIVDSNVDLILVDTGTITTLQSDVTAIKTKTDNLPANTSLELQRILGLSDENCYIDNYTKDGSNRMTGCRKRIYDSKANAVSHGATGLLATYAVTVTYSGIDFDTYLMTLEP